MSIKPGIYQHYKGLQYEVLTTATHSESGEVVVVYRCLYGDYDYWVRPLAMFVEQVELDGYAVDRFTYIGPSSEE